MLRKYGNSIPIFLIVFIFIIAAVSAEEKPLTSSAIAGKKLALVIAYRDFEDREFSIPKKMFEDEGALITIVSSRLGTAKGMYGLEVKTDVLIDEIDISHFDAVIFIGGVGVRVEYWENPKAHAIAKETVKQDKILAAICWAPVILANADVLKGKQVTGNTYAFAHKILVKKGANYTGELVTIDGNIITGFGPSTAEIFANTIIGALKKSDSLINFGIITIRSGENLAL